MPYLTPNQARLRDDIRGLIKGEVRCDEITLQLNATDAGILQVPPQAVVKPRDIDDVSTLVKYAAEKKLPVHVRGMGTGTTGESLGSGIVIDFTRSMRRVISLEHEAVTVQPGIVRSRLNHTLQKIHRRQFAPTSGFGVATTVGSILSRNGAGINWLQHGFASDHILALKFVLASGRVLTLKRDDLPLALETKEKTSTHVVLKSPLSNKESNVARGIALARGVLLGEEHALADDVYRILTQHPDALESLRDLPPVNRAGYACLDVLHGPALQHVDLIRLLAGSEGTLGLIVEAKLRTVPLPHRGAAVILFFNGLEKAIKAVEPILGFSPVLCELIDRRRLSMIREGFPRYQSVLPAEAEAALIVELEAGTQTEPLSPKEIEDRLSQLLDRVHALDRQAYTVRIELPHQFDLLDRLIHCSELILFRMQRSMQALPLFDDLALPIPALWPFLADLLDLLRQHEITASLSGHIGQGHLRVYPIVELSRFDLTPKLVQLCDDVNALLWSHGGTISSESGLGILKSHFLPSQSPAMMPIFHAIKKAFDPDGLFNPGKVIAKSPPWYRRIRSGLAARGTEYASSAHDASDALGQITEILPIEPIEEYVSGDGGIGDATQPHENSAKNPNETLSSQLELQLKWEPERIAESSYRCNGCGDCLRLATDRTNRMCPLFRRYMEEEAAPRAKANLLRGVLEGELDLSTLTSEKARQVADLCFHCRMCSFECPAEVDVSLLAFRGKSAYAAAHGFPLEDLLFSRIDSVLKCFGTAGRLGNGLCNWLLKTNWTRWLLEKTFQIPQGRDLPKLSSTSFLSRTKWSVRSARPKASPSASSATTSGKRIAFFVDVFSNFFDTRLADLAVRILEHNGLEVYVPSRQRSSGLTAFAAGNLHRAERLARHNTLLLADLIRQGYRVITLEPSSASCITSDYRYVVDDIDTALVTSNIVDFCDFLMQYYHEGKLRDDFQTLEGRIGYHAPCRSISNSTRQVDAPTPAENLLSLIPGLEVRRLEQGCCGLAGTYGLKLRNHRRSLQIGMGLFRELRHPDIDMGATDCFACRLQMEHGVNMKRTFHPIHFIAAAYGIAPELNDLEEYRSV